MFCSFCELYEMALKSQGKAYHSTRRVESCNHQQVYIRGDSQ